MEGYWAGRPQQGVEYGARAVALLTPTTERYWLGMSYFYQELNAYLMGEFAQALRLLDQAQGIGDATGNPRLQSVAAWITGWIYATQGDWAAGIARCQQGLYCSPDPLNTAGALGYLGTARLHATRAHLSQAHAVFQHLHIPRYVEQTGARATALGVLWPRETPRDG